ncbi:hypothetical protein [Deferrisoma camini]|uniref:hypothetical protein n=1 Tax=Deferrisoma camini TaxID=1035120 RepID=UPI00046CA4D5|nr:hypothetical protein [Deferrisoma camini]
MASQGESLIRKTQKGISVLAFETTKQSRILKRRMRIAALQKEIKADLRDLGNLVYNAMINDQPGILEEEEVKLLVESIRKNREEIDHLRDAIARLSRARKHFPEHEGPEVEPQAPEGDQAEPPAAEAEPAAAAPAADESGPEGKDEEAVLEPEPAPAEEKAQEEPAVPPPPGTDPGRPTGEGEAQKEDKS